MTSSAPIAAIERAVMEAIISCSHEIDHDGVLLKFSEKQPGHNAYNQLGRRVLDALAPFARKAEEMERENAELRRIGGGMANVLHHWKQQSTIRESDRLLMAVMQEEWDAVPAARSLAKGESDAQG